MIVKNINPPQCLKKACKASPLYITYIFNRFPASKTLKEMLIKASFVYITILFSRKLLISVKV